MHPNFAWGTTVHSNSILFSTQTHQCAQRSVRFGLFVAAGALLLLGPMACVSPAEPPLLIPQTIYHVGAPDRIHVRVLPEPAIDRLLTVRPDGKISLDLIGDVQAAGLTAEEIAESVQEEIGRYKRNALVTVAVVAAESDTITLFGEVQGPGTFPLRHDIRVAEAIAQLGGTTHFASKRYVRVIRAENGETVVHRVNLSRIQAGDLSSNIQLRSGDIIVVPPTILARIGYVMQQILFPFQPIIQAGGAYRNVSGLPGL